MLLFILYSFFNATVNAQSPTIRLETHEAALPFSPKCKICVFRNRVAHYVVYDECVHEKCSGVPEFHKKHNEARRKEIIPPK